MNNLFLETKRAERLKEERKRLNLIQLDAAEIINKREASWIRYEKHGEPLNQEQIYLLHEAGFDMAYVLFGESANRNDKQSLLNDLYDQVADEHKEGLIYLAKAFAAAYPK